MTRRAYRRGGIDWLGPNKAKIRMRTAPDPLTGKRRQVSRIVYGTPDEVETAMLQLRLLHSYGPIVQTDFTVDQMIEVHLSTPKRDGTERASSARYKDRSRYRLHLQPTFGKRQAGAVTPQELTIHYDQLLQNLKPNTVRLIHALIRSAYGSAIERGLLESNPATKARCPTVKEPAPVAPSVTSVEAHYRILLKSDPDMALVVRLAACLGIRRAEILALKWNHIDLESASLVITDGLINTPGIGQEITETKTGRFGWAEFPLDEQLVGELTDHRTRLEKNAAQLGVSPPDNGYVFSNSPLGETAWHPDTPSKRLRRHMLSHPELPPFTLKNLRAFASTEVIARGASLQTASAILRHESTQTTAKYYNAVREDAARSAVLDLQKIF
jgi:integrase